MLSSSDVLRRMNRHDYSAYTIWVVVLAIYGERERLCEPQIVHSPDLHTVTHASVCEMVHEAMREV